MNRDFALSSFVHTYSVALIYELLGVPRDAIAADYALSSQYGLSEPGLRSIIEKLPEVDPREFGSAPPALILNTLAYIDSKYGSVPKYLTSIGFGPEQQATLLTTLLASQ